MVPTSASAFDDEEAEEEAKHASTAPQLICFPMSNIPSTVQKAVVAGCWHMSAQIVIVQN